MSDSLFKQKVKEVLQCMCCRAKHESRQPEQEPVNAFLFSSMNMELVCAILQGI